MSFHVAADAYGRFMGQYSEPLAEQFAELAGVQAGQRALDVGCGPGALTGQLVEHLGADAVSAIDPSPPFVESMRTRWTRRGSPASGRVTWGSCSRPPAWSTSSPRR